MKVVDNAIAVIVIADVISIVVVVILQMIGTASVVAIDADILLVVEGIVVAAAVGVLVFVVVDFHASAVEAVVVVVGAVVDITVAAVDVVVDVDVFVLSDGLKNMELIGSTGGGAVSVINSINLSRPLLGKKSLYRDRG